MNTLEMPKSASQSSGAVNQPQAQRTLLIVLGVLTGLIVLCAFTTVTSATVIGFVTARLITHNIETDPAAVNAIATNIATFKLPVGYQTDYGAQLFDFLLVGYDPGDGHSHLILLQAPARWGYDQAQLEAQMRQMTPSSQRTKGNQMRVVAQKPVLIRGAMTTLVIAEGTNSDGQPYRTVSAVFLGKGGPALLTYETPVAQWNQMVVDAFIASIH